MMKAFEEYKLKAEIKTIGFLTFDAAFNYGREQGWRAALETLKTQVPHGNSHENVIDWINRELGVE